MGSLSSESSHTSPSMTSPYSLCQMTLGTNLVTLELRENLLKALPTSLSFLVKLEELDLGSNELEVL
ncbi:hypothetical protein chiPu_0022376, partial [Chiloscyllium punctatum]|nr:hypothetical protein [Chiloscyllium punctatum]